MSSNNNALAEGPRPTVSGLPSPHRCPWWMQYVLISPLRRLLEPPHKFLGPCVEPGMTVVDAGCGFGYVSLALARLVGPRGRVLSVDIEPRAVARLQRRARRAGLAQRIEARACEPRDLGLAAYRGKVDLVTVVHTLHEFEDLPGFLAQVAVLLKPEGRLLVVEPPGHVKPGQYAAELRCCHLAGFHELDPPPLGHRKMATVLHRPGDAVGLS